MSTNFRSLGDDWEHCHGAGLASCLMVLQNSYGKGLMGSTDPYSLVLPWGSNPITDGLLSSNCFQLIHDGAAFSRTEKIKNISTWPEAINNLRVCWQGELKDTNCGTCEKCIRTILNFRVLELGLPGCFEQDINNIQIIKISRLNKLQYGEFSQIIKSAKKNSISKSWVTALKLCLFHNRLRLKAKQIGW